MDGTESRIGYEDNDFVITKYFLWFSQTNIIVSGEYLVRDLIYLNSQMRVPELFFRFYEFKPRFHEVRNV